MTQENYTQLPASQVLDQTVLALKNNGFQVEVVDNSEQLIDKVRQIVPKGAEIFTGTSVTLEDTGLLKVIEESGEYKPLRPILNSMDSATHGRQKRALAAAPDFAFGSVHAVTQDGQVFVASRSGSQLPSYVQGAGHVVWVVSTKKITKDSAEAVKRIEEYVLPLESERAMKAYGVSSQINTLVNFRKAEHGRITIIFIKKDFGY